MRRWNGPDKQVTVRLPGDLHAAVKSAAPTRRINVETAYEEALTAWLKNVSARDFPDIQAMATIDEESIPFHRPGQEVKYGTVAGATYYPLTLPEHLCIERLLRILRCPKPGLPDAIISNLIQFDEFRELYERNPNPAAEYAASDPRGTGGPDATVDEALRNSRKLGRSLEELGKAGDAEHARKKGDLKPPRKRSGA